MLKRRRKSPNGVFGIEVRAWDITLFGEEPFFRAFDRTTPIFHLWRDNIVAQGISLYRATETQHFHATDDRTTLPPAYDADSIQLWITHMAMQENDNMTMLRSNNRSAIPLRYEDIVRDRAGTVEKIAQAVGVTIDQADLQHPIEGETRKIGDDWNLQAEQRFRAERPTFIAELEAARLIKASLRTQAKTPAPAKTPAQAKTPAPAKTPAQTDTPAWQFLRGEGALPHPSPSVPAHQPRKPGFVRRLLARLFGRGTAS